MSVAAAARDIWTMNTLPLPLPLPFPVPCYFQAVVGLQLDGKLQQPKFDFDCEEVRYNHRFAPFGCLVTPPVVQYKQYKVRN